MDWHTLYKPTEHFKSFCGSEWLDINRQTNKRIAYVFVEQQIKWRKPVEYEGKFLMTEYFQDLFRRKQSFFTMKEVEEWIEEFLQK